MADAGKHGNVVNRGPLPAWLALGAVLLAIVVVVLGAWTRLVDAGLGCPDWPGCYGFLTVPQSSDDVLQAQRLFPEAPVEQAKAWPEMIHRYAAGTLGLVVLALTIASWRTRLRWHCIGLSALVILQAAFGMWTVTLKLWPQVVTAHLLGGFATLSLLWLLYLRNRNLSNVSEPANREVSNEASDADSDETSPQGLKLLARVGLLVLILQITLGGWTSSNYAALACPDFPTCQGEWLPTTHMDFARGFDVGQQIGPNYLGGIMTSDARIAIHWTHRLGALLTTAILLLLIYRLWQAGLSRLALVSMFVLSVQLALGIINVMASLPLAVATAHNAVGALLLLVLVTINYRLSLFTHSETDHRSAGHS